MIDRSTSDREQTSDGGMGQESDDPRVTIQEDGFLTWILKSDEGGVKFGRDVLSSVGTVVLIALLLFGVSGVWPPLVAVESGSMEPNMHKGDMIFVADADRFAGDDPVQGTGIVTHEGGTETGHEKFGRAGDVIVFRPDGDFGETPVIHRAVYWVEAGENWVETYGDEIRLNGRTCDAVEHCPADHNGFITVGDDNRGYDQAGTGADVNVVRPEWIEGKAVLRIPWLGNVRLLLDRYVFSVASGGLTTISAIIGIAGASAFLLARTDLFR